VTKYEELAFADEPWVTRLWEHQGAVKRFARSFVDYFMSYLEAPPGVLKYLKPDCTGELNEEAKRLDVYDPCDDWWRFGFSFDLHIPGTVYFSVTILDFSIRVVGDAFEMRLRNDKPVIVEQTDASLRAYCDHVFELIKTEPKSEKEQRQRIGFA
jgi:hypothetical protein